MIKYKNRACSRPQMVYESITGNREFPFYLEQFRKARYFATIKAGGDCLNGTLAESLSFLHSHGVYPILVHGGGRQIDQELNDRCIPVQKKDGKRITDKATLDVVVYTLGKINNDCVERLDGRAMGLNGIFYARHEDNTEDYARDAEDFEIEKIDRCLDMKKIPIVSCLGKDAAGNNYNVNADSAFMCLTLGLKPMKVIILTPTVGVYKEDKLISDMSEQQLDEFLQSTYVNGGMRFKLMETKKLLDSGFTVQMTSPKFLLEELFTSQGHGTLLYPKNSKA